MLLLSGRKAWGSRGASCCPWSGRTLVRCPSPCPVPLQASFSAILGPEMEFSPREASLSQAFGVMARVVAPKVPERAACRPALPFRFPYRLRHLRAPSCTPGAPSEPSSRSPALVVSAAVVGCSHFSRPHRAVPRPQHHPHVQMRKLRRRWLSF